jgi:hypothetical protein
MGEFWGPRVPEHVHLARRVPRGSLTGASRSMPSERVRDTFVQRYDLAKYVGPKPRLRILGTTKGVSGRLQHYSLTRMVPARSWLSRSSSGIHAGLCLYSSRCRSPAGDRFGNDSAVPAGRHGDARGMSDAGKAHPAAKARWVSSRLGVATRLAPGHRVRSRRSWHELTPRPLVTGPASANCAARSTGIHIEFGHAAGAFASVSAGSVKQAAT